MSIAQLLVDKRQPRQAAKPVGARIPTENIRFHAEADRVLISDDVDVNILQESGAHPPVAIGSDQQGRVGKLPQGGNDPAQRVASGGC